MKKIFAFTLVLVICMAAFAGCAPKPTKLVMLTNAAFPPFEYLGDDNTVVGVDVDIAKEIAKDMGLELEVVDMEFDAIVSAVNSNKGDFGAAGMTITDERKKAVDFSNEYVTSAQFILVLAGNDSIRTAEDLGGKIIGVQEGTTGDFFVTDDLPTPAKEVKRYNNALDASMDLANGRLDAVVIDEMPAKSIAAKNSKLKFVEEKLTEEQYAIAVKKGNTKLLEAINKTIARLQQEGKIDEFIVNHMVG